jgi:hypothetical protein
MSGQLSEAILRSRGALPREEIGSGTWREVVPGWYERALPSAVAAPDSANWPQAFMVAMIFLSSAAVLVVALLVVA